MSNKRNHSCLPGVLGSRMDVFVNLRDRAVQLRERDMTDDRAIYEDDDRCDTGTYTINKVRPACAEAVWESTLKETV